MTFINVSIFIYIYAFTSFSYIAFEVYILSVHAFPWESNPWCWLASLLSESNCEKITNFC